MRVLLLGASSQLGSDIVCLWRDPAVTLIPATRADAAVTDSAATGCLVARVKPGLVINTTVFHNLPQAEADHHPRPRARPLALRPGAVHARKVSRRRPRALRVM